MAHEIRTLEKLNLIKPIQELYDGSWRNNHEVLVFGGAKVSMTSIVSGEFYYYFNPYCRHERCSYDLMTCDLCIQHSKKIAKLREGVNGAQNAEDNK